MANQSTEKIALITGANKGIGFETARRMGKQGITILVGARDKGRGKEAEANLRSEGVNAHFLELDVSSKLSLEAAVQGIEATYGRLDILVNNVGAVLGSPDELALPSHTDVNTLRQTFEINFFSMFSVTKALLPLLRKAPAGRIVNLSSALGSLTQQSDPINEFYQHKLLAYNASKTAVNALTVHFAYEFKDTTIKINSADPGFTATDLNGFQGTRTVEQAATIVVQLANLPDDGPSGGFFGEHGVVSW